MPVQRQYWKIGSQIVSGVGSKAYGLYFNYPVVIATYNPVNVESRLIPNSSLYAVWFEVMGAYITRGDIQTGNGSIYASSHKQSSTYIQGTKIRTKSNGIVSSGLGVLRVLDSSIIGEHQQPFKSYMPYIQSSNPASMFGRNQIFYPKEYVVDPMKNQVMGLVQRICNSKPNSYQVWGNVFTTDFVGKAASLWVGYDGSHVGNPQNKYSGDSYPNGKVLMPYNGKLDSSYRYQQACIK
jgi:hypothetical protein